MFNQGGLSLQQAPPISVVLRFLITGASFGVLLGVVLLAGYLFLGNPFLEHSFTLIVIHILALGVMASFMLGALFQMLPVVAGVVIKVPTKKAMVVHLLFLIGLCLQLFAFATNNSLGYLGAALFLGSGLLFATVLMLSQLLRVPNHSSSSKGMLFALASFVIVILLGVYLLSVLGGYSSGSHYLQLREVHYSFALFGWVALLIASISFQVIEMFYVTPKYPTLISKYLTIAIFGLLLLKALLLFVGLDSKGVDIAVALIFILYAFATLYRLYKRKRPTSDATVWFWRLGMGLLIIFMLIMALGALYPLPKGVAFAGYISFVAFAISVVFAMVYKIVPFLVWFHLSNQGYLEAPMMHDVIHPKRAKVHFYIHLATIALWIFATFTNLLFIKVIASLLLLGSFSWILYLLIAAVLKYRHTQKHSKKMEW